MASIRLENHQIFSCKFSPYTYNMIACTTLKKDPLALGGSFQIFSVVNDNLCVLKSGTWANVILDCVWSADTGSHVVTATADGFLLTWKVDECTPVVPQAVVQGHEAAVTSLDMCLVNRWVVSGSIDGSVKYWDFNCSTLIMGHKAGDAVIQLCASRQNEVAVVTADRKLKLYDHRCPPVQPLFTIDGILSCDWSQDNNFIVLGSASGTLALCDTRFGKKPFDELLCHRGGIRRLRCSKHFPLLAVSAGLDGHTVVTDLQARKVLERILHHSDVVYDVDCSSHDPHFIADCSWDSLLHVFRADSLRTLSICRKPRL